MPASPFHPATPASAPWRNRVERALGGPAPLLLGWLLLYGPIYGEAWRELWQADEHAHEPLIGLIAAALLWRAGKRLAVLPPPTFVIPGALLLACGLALSIVGRAQDIQQLAMAGQIPVLAGLLHARYGLPGVRAGAFPLCFLLFMIPLPGIAIEAITQPLKEMISLATGEALHALGYPVARSGVVLVVGQYQLLIADACSGLHSLLALLALGVLYAYLAPHPHAWHKIVLLAATLPIALAANLLRVVVLALVTYHAGDAAGRQWHDVAGIAMFGFALGGLLALDMLISRPHRARAR